MQNQKESPPSRKDIFVSIVAFAILGVAMIYLTEFIQSQNKRKKGDFVKSIQELDEEVLSYRCMPPSQSAISAALGTTAAPISCLHAIINSYSAVAWQTIEDSK